MKFGVIVGRFQVDRLTDGHISLIQRVIECSDDVLIVIGVAPLVGGKKNPLDCLARQQMIKSEFPNVMITSIKDCKEDDNWSSNLDDIIQVEPEYAVTLYGGRDSFIKNYTGKFQTVDLEDKIKDSGTETRSHIGNSNSLASRHFRSGVIHHSECLWPKPWPTVDIAAVRWINGETPEILLGRKHNEKLWRLPGGFVDMGETLELAAIRELKEETGLNSSMSGLCYLGSFNVSDWRVEGDNSIGIVTSLFEAFEIKGDPVAGDDLREVRYVSIVDAEKELIEEHIPLINYLKEMYDVE